MPNSTATKQEAKKLLAGKWPLCVAAVFVLFCFIFTFFAIYTIAFSLFNSDIAYLFISIVCLLFLVVAGFPLCLGMLRVFVKIFEEHDTDLYEMFYYFSGYKRFLKSLGLGAMLGLKFAAWAFVLFLPSTIINFVSSGDLPFLDKTPIWFSNLWVFGTFLRGVAFCLLVYIILQHFLCAYIFIKKEDFSIMETILVSKRVSKVGVSSFLGLTFSFIGWALLSVFAVPLFFTLPYAVMSYVVHCDATINYYNHTLKSPTPFSDEMDFDL